MKFTDFYLNAYKNDDKGKSKKEDKSDKFNRTGKSNTNLSDSSDGVSVLIANRGSAQVSNNNRPGQQSALSQGKTSGNSFLGRSHFDEDVQAGSHSKVAGNAQLEKTVELLKNGGLVKVPVQDGGTEDENGLKKDSVYRRVAKFLLLIGEDEAAKILPHLSEAQIEKIVPEIASIRTVDKDEANVIMAEFKELLNKSRESGGIETAREMLEKAYGKKRAEEMLQRAIPLNGKRPFEYFDDADSERIYQLIHDENVGVQCLVLSRINPKKAASVINIMKPEEKKEVVVRLAKMEPISPEVLRRVDEAMHEKSLNQTTERAEHIDGRNALAQILKKMDIGTENDILGYLSEDDPDLGQDLRSRLFTMDDVVKSDDRFVQTKLHEMSEIDIAYLIAGKPDDFREKILSNVSSGRRAEILDQEEILKPMRRSECEKITSEFFSKLRREFESGHLIIKDRNDDVFI